MDAVIGPRIRDNTEPEKREKNSKRQSLEVKTRSLNLLSSKSRNKNYIIKPKDKKKQAYSSVFNV